MDSNKRRKKTKLCNCIFCNKEFYTYNWSKQRFCSNKCYYESLKSLKSIHYCTTCGKKIEVTKYRHTKNEEYYCSRDCYNNRRKKNLKRLKRKTSYYQNLLINSKCNCGENKYYLLQIHHIDGNHNNNIEDNLEIVCANCHIKRHLKFDKDNRFIYQPKSLTDRNILDKI